MLKNIKMAIRELREGKPGARFINHYRKTRERESDRRTLWNTLKYVVVGSALVICGLVLSLPPGIPGFLLWIPGLALLAARSKPLALLLDRLELWGWQVWQKYVKRK